MWHQKIPQLMIKHQNEATLQRKIEREASQKILLNLSLSPLTEARGAFLWFYEIKNLSLKFHESKAGNKIELRFTPMLRTSIKMEAEDKNIVTLLNPHEIVNFIRRQYLDFGMVIESCFNSILKSPRPRSVGDTPST